MDLSSISSKELEQELLGRQKMLVPKIIENPDLSPLRKHCQNFIDDIVENNRIKDIEEYTYELVMVTFFGTGIFQWLNKEYHTKN